MLRTDPARLKLANPHFPQEYYLSALNQEPAYKQTLGLLRKHFDEKTISKILDLYHKIAKKDLETAIHSARVSLRSYQIGLQTGLNKDELGILLVSALLHDVGKIEISNKILKNPGKLTQAEFTRMKNHPEAGVAVVMESELPRFIPERILSGIREHHRRIDGTGYPDGDKLGISAQIIGIADDSDALSHKRVYKPSLSVSETLTVLSSHRGRFDRDLFTLCASSYLYAEK